MNYKVMSREEIQSRLGYISNNPDDARAIRKVIGIQAQIAFKTGVKKVIEWGEEICDVHYGSYLFIRRRQCENCWQEFKESKDG